MDEPKDFGPAESEENVSPEWEDGLLGDDSWDERDERALAELDAGLFITNEAVGRWLDDFSKGIRRPPPQPGE